MLNGIITECDLLNYYNRVTNKHSKEPHMKTLTESYYSNQLNSIEPGKFNTSPAQVKITHETSSTKWLSLNDESASVLVAWLDKHYTITKQESKPEIELTRIDSDVNGNPRYVCHFLSLLNGNDKFTSLDERYALALKRAKKIGGKKYHNKRYGGGIVFQSYNTSELIKSIIEASKG